MSTTNYLNICLPSIYQTTQGYAHLCFSPKLEGFYCRQRSCNVYNRQRCRPNLKLWSFATHIFTELGYLLYRPMLHYCRSEYSKQTSATFYLKYKTIFRKKNITQYVLQNACNFRQSSMCSSTHSTNNKVCIWLIEMNLQMIILAAIQFNVDKIALNHNQISRTSYTESFIHQRHSICQCYFPCGNPFPK